MLELFLSFQCERRYVMCIAIGVFMCRCPQHMCICRVGASNIFGVGDYTCFGIYIPPLTSHRGQKKTLYDHF